MAAADDWRTWLRAYGTHVRCIREFVGLSQERLARAAGVSQGAVSRLEGGRGLATPLLIVLRIQSTLAAALRAVDPAFLSDDMRALVEREHVVSFHFDGHAPALAKNAAAGELMALFHGLPEARRAKALAIFRTVVDALGTEEEDQQGVAVRA
jgi:hypothetical protein